MIDSDGYRPNVGIILINDTGQVLWARRIGQDAWQFPQGGIRQSETPVEALYRELKEELDIVPNSFNFLCSLYHPTVELQLIHYYIVESWNGEIKSLEADDVNWYNMDGALELVKADDVALNEYDRVFKIFNK